MACRPILELAFDATRRTLAQQPFTFAVANSIHGPAAVIAAVASGRTRRFSHRLITAGSIAKNFRMFFCCVTTRRLGKGGVRGLVCLRRLGLLCLPLASPPFRLGMLPASFSAGAVPLLTLGRLPAAQFLTAFWLLAVTLVLPPGQEPPAAAFAEARSPPQPPAPG